VPIHRLDDLFDEGLSPDRPILIKCDVEGAELLVLNGGMALLGRHQPELLLSVHPQILATIGQSKEMLADLLAERGYRYRCIAIDHEEHWWCEFVR